MTDTTPPQEIGRPKNFMEAEIIEAMSRMKAGRFDYFEREEVKLLCEDWLTLSEASARDRARIGELEKALEDISNFTIGNYGNGSASFIGAGAVDIAKQALSSHPRQPDGIGEAFEAVAETIRTMPPMPMAHNWIDLAMKMKTLEAALKGKTA